MTMPAEPWTTLTALLGGAKCDELVDGVSALCEGRSADELRYIAECVGFYWLLQLGTEATLARFGAEQDNKRYTGR